MKLKVAMITAALFMTACASNQVEETPQTPPAPPPSTIPAAPTGPVAGTQEDFEASVGDSRVYFDFDEFAIRPDAGETLRRQAAWLRSYPAVKVLVSGNCDERGTREYNIALGARRAKAVKDFLVLQGVEASRISTTTYGKERPIDPRSNEAAWARNRNGHTQIRSDSVVG
ncbi:MAG: peptidoglycan-associated lipoprotein Pal [Caulobacterales bacterium]|nr:peptidoglycan-associated lipoprotein Pal [Caulobacterales bacterium]